MEARRPACARTISRPTVENTIPEARTWRHQEQTVDFTSVRAGAIWQPTREQSYYFSYSTSFNPSLEQLVATTGIDRPLPPEENEAFEAGGK